MTALALIRHHFMPGLALGLMLGAFSAWLLAAR